MAHSDNYISEVGEEQQQPKHHHQKLGREGEQSCKTGGGGGGFSRAITLEKSLIIWRSL